MASESNLETKNLPSKQSVPAEEEKLDLVDYFTMLGKIGAESLKYCSDFVFFTDEQQKKYFGNYTSFMSPQIKDTCAIYLNAEESEKLQNLRNYYNIFSLTTNGLNIQSSAILVNLLSNQIKNYGICTKFNLIVQKAQQPNYEKEDIKNDIIDLFAPIMYPHNINNTKNITEVQFYGWLIHSSIDKQSPQIKLYESLNNKNQMDAEQLLITTAQCLQ